MVLGDMAHHRSLDPHNQHAKVMHLKLPQAMWERFLSACEWKRKFSGVDVTMAGVARALFEVGLESVEQEARGNGNADQNSQT